MENKTLHLTTNSIITFLTSESLFYKTENFLKSTKHISFIDILLTKICETIIQHKNNLTQNSNKDIAYLIKTSDQKYGFIFKFGFQINDSFNKFDIIFCEYNSNISQNNIRVDEYVTNNPNIHFTVKNIVKTYLNETFSKTYIISNNSNINLPKLDKTQREIVETIDKNILVKGVAGSGKTNICIDKIIFTACKNYSGKLLYTTFSRGLLIDTKLRIENYKKDLIYILEQHKLNNIIFLDKNHKKALENKLGIYFFSDDDNQIFEKIKNIINYLDNKVDYMLIEDLYAKHINKTQFTNEYDFINKYCTSTRNHQVEKYFAKLNNYSKEVIYKEIYGIILGSFNTTSPTNIMPLATYINKRSNNFSKLECESIYHIALDYIKYCQQHNWIDNNQASMQLINHIKTDFEYSLSIIDEVQDYTQINLYLFKKLSLKLFCVGDALQMINPTYFNFSYLKDLLYEKDVVEVKELKYNYRNTEKISKIIDNLGIINKKEFGTHSFVLLGQSVDSNTKTIALYNNSSDLIAKISNKGYEDITFVVSSEKDKKELSKHIKHQEILTVRDIKGLERNNIFAYNLLSSNKDKWQELSRQKINHKLADENSIFRYYFNLFYVGISRSKQNIFVYEHDKIQQFEDFFTNNFEIKNTNEIIDILDQTISKSEFSQPELISRINEFIKLGQYKNARFTANKLRDDYLRINSLRTIDISEQYISHGNYREAGIKFWEYGMIKEAKEQLTLSNDTILLELIDMCNKNTNKDLNIDIVRYFTDVIDNALAQSFIVETVKKDINKLKNNFKSIKENFRKGRK